MKQAVLCLLLLLLAGGCKEETRKSKETRAAPMATFYLIRHAEKDRSDKANADPPLTQEGMQRAKYWAQYFDTIPLDHIYSTNYVRTKITVVPVAQQKDLPVIHYEPGKLYRPDLVQEHLGHHVLVVGHSNTIPVLANKLLGDKRYGQMDDTDNSSLFVIRADSNGKKVEVRTVHPK